MKCRKEESLFKNTFFRFTSTTNQCTGNLAIPSILKLIFVYFECKNVTEIMEIAGIKSRNTVINWTNFIKENINLFEQT